MTNLLKNSLLWTRLSVATSFNETRLSLENEIFAAAVNAAVRCFHFCCLNLPLPSLLSGVHSYRLSLHVDDDDDQQKTKTMAKNLQLRRNGANSMNSNSNNNNNNSVNYFSDLYNNGNVEDAGNCQFLFSVPYHFVAFGTAVLPFFALVNTVRCLRWWSFYRRTCGPVWPEKIAKCL